MRPALCMESHGGVSLVTCTTTAHHGCKLCEHVRNAVFACLGRNFRRRPKHSDCTTGWAIRLDSIDLLPMSRRLDASAHTILSPSHRPTCLLQIIKFLLNGIHFNGNGCTLIYTLVTGGHARVYITSYFSLPLQTAHRTRSPCLRTHLAFKDEQAGAFHAARCGGFNVHRCQEGHLMLLTLCVVAAEVVALLDRNLLHAQPSLVPLWICCFQNCTLAAAALQGHSAG